MTLNADMMVERRRLRRQLTFWRIGAFVALISGLVAVGWLLMRGQNAPGAAHVARVQIEGLITGKQETFDLLKDIEDASAAKALVLRISSGGGTTSGSEALYHAVKRLAEKKPVIAVIDGVGASGAYMTALGAERIVANGSAIVGSIGVIAQVPNVSKLLDTLGVKVESVRSTPLKAMPSGVEPTSPEARAALELTVRDSYQWFRNLVGERRQLSGDALQAVADGRVFTGRQSLELKLIDEVGGEREALAWLSTAKGLSNKIPVHEYRPKTQRNRLPAIVALHEAARALGLPVPDVVDQLGERLLGAQALEGLVSVWHPASP